MMHNMCGIWYSIVIQTIFQYTTKVSITHTYVFIIACTMIPLSCAASQLNESALHQAATKKDASLTLTLLEHNADVNARDMMGDTPLKNAAAHGSIEVVQALLLHKADPNLSGSTGGPLVHARLRAEDNPQREEYALIVQLLLDAKATPCCTYREKLRAMEKRRTI